MKYLGDYTEKKTSALFKKLGAFWAFSDAQFEESAKKNVQYASVFGGLIAPKENIPTLLIELKVIQEEGRELDIKENGIENIIKRELYNHEAFYTWEYQDVIDKLKPYKITPEQIRTVFLEECKNQ